MGGGRRLRRLQTSPEQWVLAVEHFRPCSARLPAVPPAWPTKPPAAPAAGSTAPTPAATSPADAAAAPILPPSSTAGTAVEVLDFVRFHKPPNCSHDSVIRVGHSASLIHAIRTS